MNGWLRVSFCTQPEFTPLTAANLEIRKKSIPSQKDDHTKINVENPTFLDNIHTDRPCLEIKKSAYKDGRAHRETRKWLRRYTMMMTLSWMSLSA